MKKKRARILPVDLEGRDLLSLLWALLLSAAIVFGGKLHIEDNYAGTISANFFLPFRWTDLLLLSAVFAALLFALRLLCMALEKRPYAARFSAEYRKITVDRGFAALFLLVFLAWLPYYLKYAPGFFPTDAVVSMREALGLSRLSNRQPMLFALFLRLCLVQGNAFITGDVTNACRIFCLCQMTFLSFCIAYLLSWLGRRFRLRPLALALLGAVYALSPYLAQNSITMWKDPAFSGFLVLWTLTITDFCLFPELADKRSWQLRFFITGLLTCFWRSNGFTAGLMLAFTGLWLYGRKKNAKERTKALKKLVVYACALCLCWLVILGPICRLAHIGGVPREESAGIMLNQMARVAAENGRMSEADRAYLNELLPFELYPEEYRPCSVDLLKWSDRFNAEALLSSRFYKTWLSLLLKNPGSYLEAWLLNNYGFWCVNRAEVHHSVNFLEAYNLIRTERLQLGDYVLRLETPAVRDSGLLDRIGTTAWSIPLGPLNWLMFALAAVLVRERERGLLLALAPSLGLALGILVSTPIWYLPRYELAVQMLTPFFLLLLLPDGVTDRLLRREKDRARETAPRA